MRALFKFFAALFLIVAIEGNAADTMSAPSHGVAYPAGWQNWATIAVSEYLGSE